MAAAAGAQTVTIYSSVPLGGPFRAQAEDVVRAEQLALEQVDSRVASVTVRFVSLNDATAAAGRWDPGQTSVNARTAVRDESTIAYLGEFNSGATAVSLPILNEGGIAQVSPSNTYVGLTRGEGGCCGDPSRWYPTGQRTYARVIPADRVQAAAIARYMQVLGVRRVFVVDDGEVYGHGLARMVQRRLGHRRIVAVGRARLARRAGNASAIARRVAATHADALFFGGITQNGAPGLWRAVHRHSPRVLLFGTDGVAERAFTRRIGADAAARTYITGTALPARAYPPSAERFFAAFRARYGRPARPFAIDGYEAMSLVLDCLRRAGPGAVDRAAVVRQLFATSNRDSVLGRYSIDAFGDTTLTRQGGFRVSRRGNLEFDRVLDAAA
jgi:branched-chain amino acid transport system substrate-binding protein